MVLNFAKVAKKGIFTFYISSSMLVIYSENISSRVDYVFDLVFKQEFEIEYSLTSDRNVFNARQAEKINYASARNSETEFFIKSAPLLFENFIEKKESPVVEKFETTILFPNDASCDLGFDVFSAIFYMVSRYEEYLPFTSDAHGRYKASDSLAFRHHFLEIPVVNVWLRILRKTLQKKFPALSFKSLSFKAILTYDIDVAFKFKGRSIGRMIGAMGKDLLRWNWKNLIQRKLTILHLRKDPWDVYDYLCETITKNKLDSRFFFLLADKGQHDRNLDWQGAVMKNLIRKIQAFSETGIHPSYQSSQASEKILLEKQRLEELGGKIINKSRQHFLRFTLPDTYDALLQAGITEDYSMGFPSIQGFRAGTCTPFYFYNLKREKATKLKIFPVTFMEGIFISINKPNDALQEMLKMMEAVKNVGGTFISIWHNHTVSATAEYQAWREVHEQVIRAILQTRS
jgi:hypothetical protein